MTDYLNNPSAVTRWLETHRDQFYTELAVRLDVEAGLKEVLLAARHNVFINEVHNKLDVEAGLAEILPPLPPELPDAALLAHEAGTLGWASDELDRMPLRTRLKLRGDHASKLRFAAREISTFITEGAYTIEGIVDLGPRLRTLLGKSCPPSTLDPMWKRNLNYLLNPEYLSTDHHSEGLENVVVSAAEFQVEAYAKPYSFEDALRAFDDYGDRIAANWKATVAGYIEAELTTVVKDEVQHLRPNPGRVTDKRHLLQLGRDLRACAERIAEELTRLISYLTFLEQMLNDFRGTDLRGTDLAGVQLEGLRWSESTTQWPDKWQEKIRQDSVHLENDIYEVHYGTHTRGRNTLV